MPRGTTSGGQRGGAAKGSPPFEEDAERDDDAPGPDHNGRLTSLAGLIEGVCDLQDKEDALLKKYILPLREKKAELKAEAKKDFEIPVESFNARAALRRIERSEGQEEVVLATRELFEALPIGKNLDLEAMLEKVNTRKAEKEAKKNKANVEEQAVN